jgi:CDP-diglyceride synthetase
MKNASHRRLSKTSGFGSWDPRNEVLLAGLALIILWHPVVYFLVYGKLWETTLDTFLLVLLLLYLATIMTTPWEHPSARQISLIAVAQSFLIHVLPSTVGNLSGTLTPVVFSSLAAWSTALFVYVFLPGFGSHKRLLRIFLTKPWDGPMAASQALTTVPSEPPSVIVVSDKNRNVKAIVLGSTPLRLPDIIDCDEDHTWTIAVNDRAEAITVASELSASYRVPVFEHPGPCPDSSAHLEP